MTSDFIIGCVGKPSAGKSTFFNSVAEHANAKVGNYPFTTIEANQGVAYYSTDCPCQIYNVKCKPRFGACTNGRRRVPVKMLDIAGLIPGASLGRGLGNKFLDDLRHADVLIHIIDVSGNTNEKGEITSNYDPSNDHDWLVEEINLWIFNNMWNRWASITRRHKLTNSTFVSTFLTQLSGYGAKEKLINALYNKLNLKDPVDLSTWTKDTLKQLVNNFVQNRFKFVLLLNKVDSGDQSDQNTLKISQKYPDTPMSTSSALAECFLKKMKQQKYIIYKEGDMFFTTSEDDEVESQNLKKMDDKLKTRLKNIQDMVLFRYGSTGVHSAINMAVESLGLIPIYHVKNVNSFGNSNTEGEAFPDCTLIKTGTKIKSFINKLGAETARDFLYAEGIDGRKIADGEPLTLNNNIFRLVTR